MNKNALIIDGELSELMSNIICDELSHSSHITSVYFADNISAHSLQLILNKIAFTDNISDVYFAQDYKQEILSLAINLLNSSRSKKTIWAHVTDIEQQEIAGYSNSSLVTITNAHLTQYKKITRLCEESEAI